MDNKTAKLHAKIRKMMAMAERAEGNEEEAAVAARMVEKLMRKHNLSIGEVSPEQMKSDILGKEWDKMKWTPGRCPIWVTNIAIAISGVYDTFVTFTAANYNDNHVAKQQMNLRFVGTDLDVQVSLDMFSYLYTTIIRLTNKHFKENPTPQGKARTFKNSFRVGMANRLRERLSELKTEREREFEKVGSALIVVKQGAISDFLGYKAQYGTSNRKSSHADSAYTAGYKTGGNVSLNSQLS